MGKEVDQIKPTLALEYQFARRPRIGVPSTTSKDISHVWELGGGLTVPSLIGIPLMPDLTSTTIVIVLDMSDVPNVLPHLLKWVDVVGRKVREKVGEVDRRGEVRDLLERRKIERIGGSNHPDS